MSTCTTHHYACDCREAEWKALVEELSLMLGMASGYIQRHGLGESPRFSSDVKSVIARAEKLLSSTKEGTKTSGKKDSTIDRSISHKASCCIKGCEGDCY